MRYLIVALVVSLCWLHQDWLVWPLLADVQKEHDLMLGIPAGLGYHVAISFAAAAVWFLAVWKAWPTELEQWAGSGSSRRGGGNRRGGRGRSSRGESRGDNRPSGDRPREGNGGNSGESGESGITETHPRRRRGGRGRRRGGPGQGNGGQSQSSSNPS